MMDRAARHGLYPVDVTPAADIDPAIEPSVPLRSDTALSRITFDFRTRARY